jgi:hypothetical protein
MLKWMKAKHKEKRAYFTFGAALFDFQGEGPECAILSPSI